MWAIAGLSGGEAPAAVSLALVRARGCERIGELVGGSDTSGLFLFGLCSLLDVILRQPMEVALTDMPLPTPVREALLGAQTRRARRSTRSSLTSEASGMPPAN